MAFTPPPLSTLETPPAPSTGFVPPPLESLEQAPAAPFAPPPVDSFEPARSFTSRPEQYVNLLARGAISEGVLPAAQGIVGVLGQQAEVPSASGLTDDERAAEILKGLQERGWGNNPIGRGAIRFLETLRSTSRNIQKSLLDSEKSLGEAREFVRESLPVDNDIVVSKAGQIIQGLGQAAGTLPIWLIPSIGQVAGPMASAGQIYQEAHDDAVATLVERREQGEVDLSDEEINLMAHDAGVKNLPAAALDALGDRLIVGRLLKPFKGKISVGRLAKEIAVKAAAEGATEGAQQTWLNAVASSLEGFDPGRPLDQDVIDSIVVGMVVGGITSGAIDTASAVQSNRRTQLEALATLQTAQAEAAQLATTVSRIGTPEREAALNDELATQDDVVDAQNQIIDQAREAQALHQGIAQNAQQAQQVLELAQQEQQQLELAAQAEPEDTAAALETLGALSEMTEEDVANEVALDVADPYSLVEQRYPEAAALFETDQRLRGQLLVEIQRADGSKEPAAFAGYWDIPGRGSVPAVGYWTGDGFSHGLLNPQESILTTVPTPEQWDAGVRSFAQLEEQAQPTTPTEGEVPSAQETGSEVETRGQEEGARQEAAGGVRVRDDAQAGLEAVPGEVAATAVAERTLPANTRVTVQRGLVEGDRGSVQVDLFDEAGANIESTNPAELEGRGIIPPFIPADIPQGQYTLAELEALVNERLQRGEQVEALETDEAGLIRLPEQQQAQLQEEAREAPRPSPQSPANVQAAKRKRLARIGLPADQNPDIINALQDQGGVPAPRREGAGGEYDRFRETFNRGIARFLINTDFPGSKYGPGGLDTFLQEFFASHPEFAPPGVLVRDEFSPTGFTAQVDQAAIDSFYDSVERALQTRESLRTAMLEAGKIESLEQSFLANEKDLKKRQAVRSVSIDELQVGDSFKINGEKFTVIDIDPDGNVVIEDGLRYTVASGTEVYPDKRSLRRVEREIEFVPELETAPEAEPVAAAVETATPELAEEAPALAEEPAPVAEAAAPAPPADITITRTGDNFFVEAKRDGERVGFARFQAREGRAYPLYVDVEPEFRRQGIATEMYRRFAEEYPLLPISESAIQLPEGRAFRAALAERGTLELAAQGEGLELTPAEEVDDFAPAEIDEEMEPPADQPQEVEQPPTVGAAPAGTVIEVQNATGVPAPVSVPSTQYAPAGMVPNMDPAAGGLANLEAAEMEGLSELADIPEEAGTARRIITQVFGERFGVLGKRQLTPDERFRARQRANSMFNQARLPVIWDDQNEVYRLANPTLPAEEEGQQLLELLRQEFERGVGPNDALLSVIINSIRNPDGGLWKSEAFSPGLRNNMFSLAQGEASFYGLMLGALSKAKRTLSFVAENVDVVLHKAYSKAFGGDAVQTVLDRTKKRTGDDLAEEIDEKIRKRKRKPRKAKDRDKPEEVPEDFDGEEAMEEVNENQRSANTLVEQFARIQSDTPDLQTNQNINEVRRLFFAQVVAPGERQGFINSLIALQVDPQTAQILFSIAGRETSARKIARDVREIDRPAREALSILERFAVIQSDTPSLQTGRTSEVRTLFGEQVDNPTSLEAFTAGMEALGVEPTVARNLFEVAATERRNRQLTREIRDLMRPNAATRTAEAEIARLARIHSDVQAWTKAETNQVAEAIRNQKKSPQPDERFQEILEGLGVNPATAQTLVNAVRLETDARARIAELNLERRVASPRPERAEGAAPSTTSGIRPLIQRIISAPPSQQADVEWRKRIALEFFQDNGLTPAQAQEAQQIFDSEFTALLDQTRRRAFDQVRQNLTKRERQQIGGFRPGKKLWQRIEEAVNTGIFDNSDVLKELAKDYGWSIPTQEQKDRLKALADREQVLRTLTEEERKSIGDNPTAIQRATMEKAAATKQARLELRRQMQTTWSRFSRPITWRTPEGRRNFGAAGSEFLSANMLLKLGFGVKQIIDVGSQVVWHIPTRAAAYAWQRHQARGADASLGEFTQDLSQTLGESMTDMTRSASDALTQFRQGILGRGELRNVEGLASTISLFDRWRQRADEMQARGEHAKALGLRLLGIAQFSFRWARALDNVQGTFIEAQEARQRLISELEENGLSTEEARRQANDILGDRNAEMHLSLARAAEILGANEITATPLELKAAAYEIYKARQYGRMDAAGLDSNQIAENADTLRNTVGWNMPETEGLGGVVGAPVRALGRGLERFGLPLPIGRFGNAIAISVNRALTWTPAGFFPELFGGEQNAWFARPVDRTQRKFEAAAGTAIGGALIAAMAGGLLRVWNKAPDDPEERELWEKQGHRAGTVEINVGDGRFIPISTSSGPFTYARPWLGAIGELQDAMARREKMRASFARRVARRGGVVQDLPELTGKDAFMALMWGGFQAAFGGRTAGGAVRGFTREDTRAPDIQMFASQQISPFFLGLPAYQEVQRALGTRIDPRFGTVLDLVMPMQGSPAARQNFLGDSLTRDRTQTIIQTLTGGTFPGVVDPSTVEEMTPYRILSRIPYRPGAISRNEGYLIDGVVRPLTDEEFIKVQRLRGSYFKQALMGVDESVSDEDLNVIAQRLANESRRQALERGAGAQAFSFEQVADVDRQTEEFADSATRLYAQVRNLPQDQWLRVINEEIAAGRIPLQDGQPHPLFVAEWNRRVTSGSER